MLCTPGVGVNVVFNDAVTTKQWAWLSSTIVPIDSITFSREEPMQEFLTQVRFMTARHAPSAVSQRVGAMQRPSQLTKNGSCCPGAHYVPLGRRLNMQDGPPLPASLKAVQLEPGDNADLMKLTCNDGRMIAAGGLKLVAKAEIIQCKQRGIWNGPPEPPVPQPVSHLPAGFSALELQTQCVLIYYISSVTSFGANPATAAHLLCIFFECAPSSYRQFSLRWPAELPLSICFTDMGDTWKRNEGIEYEPRLVAFDAAEALAEHMRRCVARAQHKMSVTVHKEAKLNRIVVVRL